VTSSSTTFAGLSNATGVTATDRIDSIGVVKAYTTRVGEGHFPTELSGKIENRLRERGGEFGVTTGRPRRCGWLDLVALKHAAALNRLTGLAITKIDVLSGMEESKVCRAYRVGKREIMRFPLGEEELAHCEPIYETLAGWKEEIQTARTLDALPTAARSYVDRISQVLEVPLTLVSVGPAPEETIAIGFDRP